jgi:hypothetical protein
MGRKLLNFTLLVLLGPLLVTFAYEGALFVLSVFTLGATTWFLLGAGISLLIHLLLLGDSVDFLEALMHELEHAALAFLFTFRLPTKMEINPKGKSSVQVGGGGCLAVLAPYYLPLLTLPLLLVKALAALGFSQFGIDSPTLLALALDLLIGASLAFHLATTLKEFRPSKQDDIKEVGLIPSLVGVLFLNVIFVVLSIAVVTGSYEELWASVKTAATGTLNAYQAAYVFLTERLLPGGGDLVQQAVDWISGRFAPAPVP